MADRRLLQPCAMQPCGALVERGRCLKHQQEMERGRGTTAQRGYASGWPKIRAAVLRDNPLCQIRYPGICTVVATEVDHIVPIHQRPGLRLEPSNLQAACKQCNVAKSNDGNGLNAKD